MAYENLFSVLYKKGEIVRVLGDIQGAYKLSEDFAKQYFHKY